MRYRVNNGVRNQLTQYVHNQQNDLGPTSDFCGIISNPNFGGATLSNTIDPEILRAGAYGRRT